MTINISLILEKSTDIICPSSACALPSEPGCSETASESLSRNYCYYKQLTVNKFKSLLALTQLQTVLGLTTPAAEVLATRDVGVTIFGQRPTVRLHTDPATPTLRPT